MSTNGVDLYGAALAPTAFGLSNGMPAFAQSSALPAGTNMNDTLSRGTSHASIVDQLSSAQGIAFSTAMPTSSAVSRPISNGLPSSQLGLNNPQAPMHYAAAADTFGHPGSASSFNHLPSLHPNHLLVNQPPSRANDLAMLQQQLQGLSVMPPAPSVASGGLPKQQAFVGDPYHNPVASAQMLARMQTHQNQQSQLLAAQLQAATAGSNLSTLQINALRQTLAAKQQVAMQQRAVPQGQPNSMAVIAEASRIAALRAQQQQLAQGAGGARTGMHAATIQSLLAQGHGTQQPATIRPVRQPPIQQHVHDANYKDKLVEMGVGLAQNNITIETAVNAGLLGGLSASDVRILAAAHQAETQRQEMARQGAYAATASQKNLPARLTTYPPPPSVLPQSHAILPQSHAILSNMPSNHHNVAVEPQALFDASRLGTSLFGCGSTAGSVASGAATEPPLALQQQGFFSFFGNNDDDHPVLDDDAKSSANNTSDGSQVTSTTNTEPLHSASADAAAHAFLCPPHATRQLTGAVASQDPPFSSSFDYSLQAAVQRTIPAVPATHEA